MVPGKSVWVDFGEYPWGSTAPEEVQDCRLIKLFFLTRNRAAGSYRRVMLYESVSGFSTDMISLIARAERNREQGASWTISELPALAVLGKTISLLVTEFDSNPLLGREPDLGDNKTVRAIGKLYSPEREDSIVRIVTNIIEFERITFPLCSFDSFSEGKACELGWRKRLNRIDVSPLIHNLYEIWEVAVRNNTELCQRQDYLKLLRSCE